MVKSFFLTVLWVLTVALLVFSMVSWAGLVVRTPAIIALVVAIGATVMARTTRFRKLWVPACFTGFVLAFSLIGIVVHSLDTGYTTESSYDRTTVIQPHSWIVV